MTERKHIKRVGPGRRGQDWVPKCPWCEEKDKATVERWKNHHEEENDRRVACKEVIEKLETKQERLAGSIIGRSTFWIVISIVLSAIGAVGFQQNWAFKEILSNQSNFSIQLNQVENNQIVIKEKVRLLEEAHKVDKK